MSHFRNRFGEADSSATLPENVIDLSAVRKLRQLKTAHNVFYINESQTWLPDLEKITYINTIALHNDRSLDAALLTSAPDVILVESELSWSDPISLIENLAQLYSAPIVLLYTPESTRYNPDLLKDAYRKGVSDTLLAPLETHDLYQTLKVLLQMRMSLP